MLGEEAYARARKLGIKEYHSRMQRRLNPILPALEELEGALYARTQVSLGLMPVPLTKVVGSASRGRTSAFAANFMPILDSGSEFATKWATLYDGVVADGLRQPVKTLEYMGQYYLVEGNKRVSVMKYLDSVFIEAEVTRVMPAADDSDAYRLYRRFLGFYEDTHINYLWLTKPESYDALIELTGHTPGTAWTSEELSDFSAAYMRFREEYKAREAAHSQDRLPATTGDAFLIYLKACGYDGAQPKYAPQLRGELKALWGEFEKEKTPESVDLIMKPDRLKKGAGLLNTLFGPNAVKVAFLYTRQPGESGWTYWHDVGRMSLENALGERVKTSVSVCDDPAGYEAEIERLIAEGSALIFATSPVMLSACMKASVKHPEARILNCSLLASWQRVRSYYLRTYEVKLLLGIIAGATTETDRIGYVADYPIAGMAAVINAYALGARMVNPRVKVQLTWSSHRDYDPDCPFDDPAVDVICGRDVGEPSRDAVEYGLYAVKDGQKRNLAAPVLDWGRIYESLARSVLKGNWKEDGSEKPRAVNYWWGLSSGAVDLVMIPELDPRLKRLVELVKEHVREGVFAPFEGLIRDQSGAARCPADGKLTPADVIAMDWLTDNVIGGFPELDELKEQARALVELQGIRQIKLPAASTFSWRAEEV